MTEHPEAAAFFEKLEAMPAADLWRVHLATGVPYNSIKRLIQSRDARVTRYLQIRDAVEAME